MRLPRLCSSIVTHDFRVSLAGLSFLAVSTLSPRPLGPHCNRRRLGQVVGNPISRGGYDEKGSFMTFFHLRRVDPPSFR
jgi:hypothetical protein